MRLGTAVGCVVVLLATGFFARDFLSQQVAAKLDEALGLEKAPAVRIGKYEESFSAKVVGVIDGDTIKVLKDGKEQRVRLWGIDAPENGQPFSAAAKKHLSDILMGKEITVDAVDYDPYGRIVGKVSYDFGGGAVVKASTEMVSKGYAWWFRKYAPDAKDLEAWEKKAREGKRGLWSEPGAVAPWEWRKN